MVGGCTTKRTLIYGVMKLDLELDLELDWNIVKTVLEQVMCTVCMWLI